jgi:hypothetical protein
VHNSNQKSAVKTTLGLNQTGGLVNPELHFVVEADGTFTGYYFI